MRTPPFQSSYKSFALICLLGFCFTFALHSRADTNATAEEKVVAEMSLEDLVKVQVAVGTLAGSEFRKVPATVTTITSQDIKESMKQWGELHPGHKALITRAEYIACSRSLGTNVATGDETFKVLRIRNEKIHVFGVPQTTSEVVTISFHSPISNETPRYDMHAVAVDGHWTWILGGKFIAAIKQGKCLDGSPLQVASAPKP